MADTSGDAEAGPPHGHDCRKVATILARVGDKWSVLIVRLLGGGDRRFNEIKREVGGISQRMLSLTLRGLERDGLVTRAVTPSVPPRVDYALTDLGRSLWEPVSALGAWAVANHAAIEAARTRFDAAKTPVAPSAAKRRPHPDGRRDGGLPSGPPYGSPRPSATASQ